MSASSRRRRSAQASTARRYATGVEYRRPLNRNPSSGSTGRRRIMHPRSRRRPWQLHAAGDDAIQTGRPDRHSATAATRRAGPALSAAAAQPSAPDAPSPRADLPPTRPSRSVIACSSSSGSTQRTISLSKASSCCSSSYRAITSRHSTRPLDRAPFGGAGICALAIVSSCSDLNSVVFQRFLRYFPPTHKAKNVRAAIAKASRAARAWSSRPRICGGMLSARPPQGRRRGHVVPSTVCRQG